MEHKTAAFILRITLFSIVALLISSCQEDTVESGIFDVDVQPTICSTMELIDPQYTVDVVRGVRFAEATKVDGTPTTLLMDIYRPVGSPFAVHPVAVLSFGGAFIGGDRLQLETNARDLASRGYVAACIDYRLFPFLQFGFPDNEEALDIAIKASNDVKAAIRFLRHSGQSAANPYQIDPDQIVLGGVSAGSIAGIQAAYFDSEDYNISSDTVKMIIDANGGLSGDSGLPETEGISTEVSGVVNYSGAVYQIDFLDSGEAPMVSMHGDADEVVSYVTDFVRVFGFEIDLILNGSSVMHNHLTQIGIPNQLYTVPGGGHDNIYTQEQYASDRDMFNTLMLSFVKEELCN